MVESERWRKRERDFKVWYLDKHGVLLTARESKYREIERERERERVI